MPELKNNLISAPLQYIYRLSGEVLDAAPYRNEFERDRDRILYSKEFRRLSGKTQVFLSTSNDQIRTRLTHTLEVAQISRITATKLNLDATLAEAISLGHDVGHTPFGHVGENVLSLLMNGCDKIAKFQEEMKNEDRGFKHNYQSIRVVCDLEQLYGKIGLNLTNFTMWGFANHTKRKWSDCYYFNDADKQCYLHRDPSPCNSNGKASVEFYNRYNKNIYLRESDDEAWSFEGEIVKITDEIAQRHHDIEDAIRMGIITTDELNNNIEIFQEFFNKDEKKIYNRLLENKDSPTIYLPYASKLIVHFLNRSLIENSKENLLNFIREYDIKTEKDFTDIYPKIKYDEINNIISLPPELARKEDVFHKFLKDRVLNSFEVQRMDGKGRFIIRRLFKAYLTNPRQLHDITIKFVFKIYDPDNKDYFKIDESELGSLRVHIDSPTKKADPRFQIALLRGICDHIAGMTDDFALSEYKRLYG